MCGWGGGRTGVREQLYGLWDTLRGAIEASELKSKVYERRKTPNLSPFRPPPGVVGRCWGSMSVYD